MEYKAINQFPSNPKHGDVYEYKAGLLYQYDAGVNGWIPVVSSSASLQLATPIKSGAMSSLDLQKLNRLVLPFPQSTVIGNDCDFPFSRGQISLSSGDQFVKVEGAVKVRNIDEVGDDIEATIDYHIHQHTYGFDFTLDLPNLVDELIRLGQLKIQGNVGPKGDKGVKGDSGSSLIVSGPPGEKGDPGNAPECSLSIEPEPVSANPKLGLEKAFVDVRVKDHPTDTSKYYLEFDRQSIGDPNRAVDRLNVDKFGSYWVVAVASSTAGNKRIYYLDVEPIISAIRTKYLEQVELLKAGYESITKHWVQTMSDLFDEQKAALCCAIENCISKTKGVDTRRHMESTAAAVIPDGKIKINVFPPRGEPHQEAKKVSNTRLTPGNDCYIKPAATTTQLVKVDAAANATVKSAATVTLPPGKYTAAIQSMNVKIDEQYGSMIRVRHAQGGAAKTTSFLDKGRYDDQAVAKDAYEGLSLAIDHDGGDISFYLPSYIANHISGGATIEITPSTLVDTQASEDEPKAKQEAFYCTMPHTHLDWYKDGWESGTCCGVVVQIAGQQYIIIKRGIGDDEACGGGEKLTTKCVDECIKRYDSHPAFAWPTLNGIDFAPIPAVDIGFTYDPELNEMVRDRLDSNDYKNTKGNPDTYRHLAHQLDFVLFPTNG